MSLAPARSLISLAVVLFFPGFSAAADCVDYESFLHRSGLIRTSGDFAEGIASDGHYVYVSSFTQDYRNGSVASTGFIDVFDALDRFPQHVGRLELALPGSNRYEDLHDITLVGSHLFVAADEMGILVVDVTDPGNPVLVGSYDTPHFAQDVVVEGDHAYVADLADGDLLILDVSVPTSPVLVGSYPMNYATAVSVENGYLYATSGPTSAGLLILDVTNPAAPTPVASYPGRFDNVTVEDGYAYLANATGFGAGMILDVHDPSQPQYVADLPVPASTNVTVSGDRLVVCTSAGMTLVDAGGSGYPVLGAVKVLPFANDAALVGNRVFVADGAAQLQVVEAANPAAVAAIGTLAVAGSGVTGAGDLAVVVDRTDFRTIDVSDESNPVEVGHLTLSGSTSSVVLRDDLAFVPTSGSGALHVVDVADPTAPAEIGTLALPGYPHWMALRGDWAFVTDGSSLLVVDVSDPTSPGLTAELPLPGASRLDVEGDMAFLPLVGDLVAVDLSDPFAPVVVGELYTGRPPGAPSRSVPIEVVGSIAYIASYGDGMWLMDVSDPTAMRKFGVSSAGDRITDLRVVGNTLVAAAVFSGVLIYDLTNPLVPRLVGSAAAAPGQGGQPLAVDGDRILTATPFGRFDIFPPHCGAVAFAGPTAAASSSVPTARGIALELAGRNPSPDASSLSLELPWTTRARVTVHDVSGRLVRTLADGTFGAGVTPVRWDGRSASGARMPAGVYFVRLQAGDQVRARKVVLSR